MNSTQELSKQNHNERQHNEVSREGLERSALKLSATNKFKNIDGAWVPQPYKGYAIVSMLDTNPDNKLLSDTLVDIQRKILDATNLPRNFFLLPKESFHQTVVNTLSGTRFKEHIIDKGLEEEYPDIIKNGFDKVTQELLDSPIQMKFAGVSIFGSALGILGTIEDDSHWEAIMNLRNQMYSNPDLNQHDIKRTRPFIAHISLAYIDGQLTDEVKAKLVDTIDQINQSEEMKKLVFTIKHTELRSYEHLDVFNTKPNYPLFNFS